VVENQENPSPLALISLLQSHPCLQPPTQVRFLWRRREDSWNAKGRDDESHEKKMKGRTDRQFGG
jgi:hypothetical protein